MVLGFVLPSVGTLSLSSGQKVEEDGSGHYTVDFSLCPFHWSWQEHLWLLHRNDHQVEDGREWKTAGLGIVHNLLPSNTAPPSHLMFGTVSIVTNSAEGFHVLNSYQPYKITDLEQLFFGILCWFILELPNFLQCHKMQPSEDFFTMPPLDCPLPISKY